MKFDSCRNGILQEIRELWRQYKIYKGRKLLARSDKVKRKDSLK